MNPLDKLELFAFARKLNEEMPLHTESTAKIKRSYSQGMPKNLMDYSAFVDNHFLNDNLAIIEEMQHRDKSHPIPKWFRNYQLRHYAKYGILKGDHFFGAKLGIIPDLGEHRGIGFLPFTGITLGFGTIGDTKVFGSTMYVGEGATTTANSGAGHLIGSITDSNPTIGQYYDQIAVYSNGNANWKAGAYQVDGSDVPQALYAETGGFSGAVNMQWQSLSEFSIVTAKLMLVAMQDATAVTGYRTTVIGTNTNRTGYGYSNSLPNPFGGSGQAETKILKLGHS